MKNWITTTKQIFFQVTKSTAFYGIGFLLTIQLGLNMLIFAIVPKLVPETNLTKWFLAANLYRWTYVITMVAISILLIRMIYKHYKKEKELKTMKDCGTTFVADKDCINFYNKAGKNIGHLSCICCAKKLEKAINDAKQYWDGE